ncbi:hypothetical protein GCM10007913_25900 [Devosia yakushimensis]|uniref:Uncharacterized protein n=1 Tax=Devosia yakushimensis TaxID=470028 RepID=A0ABQ5UF26_9HYPH|nr:hypothetical protein [Devosia yakushimensis]GLQ10658.1 hypothetical protein GCM10007913_25900 [Devosia yakushimensis]
MRARLDDTALAEWQRLMAEWDEVSRELDGARKASAGSGPNDAELSRLTARLQVLQGSIDALIKQTQSVRDPQRRDLLVATIQRGLAAEDQAGDDKPTAPSRITARSK